MYDTYHQSLQDDRDMSSTEGKIYPLSILDGKKKTITANTFGVCPIVLVQKSLVRRFAADAVLV